MNKVLMSGNCFMGTVGDPSSLVDSFGEALYIGDLVALSVFDPKFPDSCAGTYGVEFVCHNATGDDGLPVHKYVMGIASEHFEDEIGSIVQQNHSMWRIRKVKGFEQVAPTEKWGAVRMEVIPE